MKKPVRVANIQKSIWNTIRIDPIANKPNIQVKPRTIKQLNATENLDNCWDSAIWLLRNRAPVWPHKSE